MSFRMGQYLQFLKNMEMVDRAIRRADDLEEMLDDTLQTVRDIFAADRVFLLHPCDPNAEEFSVPIESTSPEYPGASEMGYDAALAPSTKMLCRELIKAEGPMCFGEAGEIPIPEEQFQRFAMKSIMCVALFPKAGAPWVLGMHQCSRHRKWNEEERRLFQEISRRLTDALSSLLTLRDLRESEARHRTLIENIPGAVYRCRIVNHDLQIVFASNQIEEITGYPPSYFVDNSIKNYFDLVHPEDLGRLKEGLEQRIERNEPIHLEYRLITAAGEICWISSRGRPVFDERGKLLTLDGVINDITDKKLAEEALVRSEEKYRSLFEWSADPMLLIDSGTFINCNNAAVEMLHCKSKDEILYTRPWDLSPEFQPDGVSSREKAEAILASMPQVKSRRFEWMHRRADGQLFHAEVLLTFIPVAGRPLVNTVWRDLTELKEAEKEARRLRNLLANIVNSMPSTLIGVDHDANVTQWNRMAQQTTGIAPQDAMGKRIADVYPRLAERIADIHRAIERREAVREAKSPVNIEGDTRFSDITIYPLVTNGAEGAVIRIDDVTERVRIEEMMVQSEKMLSVAGLAAGMAHEINNPLAGILQSVQVVLDRLSPGLDANQTAARQYGIDLAALEEYMKSRKIVEMLSGMRESGRRAARIVENMLSFSRKSSARFENADLVELIDRTLELAANDYVLKKSFHFREIEIRRQYAADLPPVPCEKTEIQQVILNILKNGAHAMVEGGPSSRPPCFIIRTLREGDTARIEIQDNGPGMDEAVRLRVFEPFFTTKNVGVGTGLGLSVSYFIICENHQGKLSVISAPDQGAKFIIQLPLKRKTS